MTGEMLQRILFLGRNGVADRQIPTGCNLNINLRPIFYTLRLKNFLECRLQLDSSFYKNEVSFNSLRSGISKYNVIYVKITCS